MGLGFCVAPRRNVAVHTNAPTSRIVLLDSCAQHGSIWMSWVALVLCARQLSSSDDAAGAPSRPWASRTKD